MLTLIYQWFFILTTVPQKFKAITLGGRNWLRGYEMAAELSLRAPTEPETVPKPRVCLRRRQVNPEHVFLLFPSYSSLPRSACGMYVWGWWWYMCVGLHAKARCSHRVYFSISHLMYKGRGFQLNPEFGQGVTLPCLCPLSLLGLHTGCHTS